MDKTRKAAQPTPLPEYVAALLEFPFLTPVQMGLVTVRKRNIFKVLNYFMFLAITSNIFSFRRLF